MGTVLRDVRRRGGQGSSSSHAQLDSVPTHDSARDAATRRRHLEELRHALPEDSGTQLCHTVEQPLPSLYATSFLAARASAAVSCENCREGDHKSKECTLSTVTTSLSKSGGFEQSAPYHTPRRSSVEGNGRAVGPGFADRPTCKKCNFSPS